MNIELHVYTADNKSKIHANIERMSHADALSTISPDMPWQTSWLSDFISDENKEKYSLKTDDGELLALVAYEIVEDKLFVEIAYMESQPESNPTISSAKKYFGIGKALIAYGVVLSVNRGCYGAVVLQAKTSELAKHYAEDFNAMQIPSFGGAPRFLIEGNAAMEILSDYILCD